MKKLGLVGGMGPESTIVYYHDIVFGVQKKLGTQVFPTLTVESVDMYEMLELCSKNSYDELVEFLLKPINTLINCGADYIAMSANTPHIVFDRLKEKTDIPLISIVDTACCEARRRQYRKLALFGTIFTMKSDFYKKPFRMQGMEIITPAEEEMAFINQKLASELEFGIVKADTLASFKEIITRMKKEDSIDAVILGCTELPLLLSDKVSPVPCLDTMQIHIDTLVNLIAEQ